MENWISVSESLPTVAPDERGVRVIACTDKREVREMAYVIKQGEAVGAWLETNGDSPADQVTHWMDMPAAADPDAVETEETLIEYYHRIYKIRMEIDQVLANAGQQFGREMARAMPDGRYSRGSPFYMSKCEDCGKITPQGHMGFMFHYLVTDELWKEATAPDLSIMLCLHCLQKRVGRPLTVEDFPKHKINMHKYVEELVVYANNPDAKSNFL